MTFFAIRPASLKLCIPTKRKFVTPLLTLDKSNHYTSQYVTKFHSSTLHSISHHIITFVIKLSLILAIAFSSRSVKISLEDLNRNKLKVKAVMRTVHTCIPINVL